MTMISMKETITLFISTCGLVFICSGSLNKFMCLISMRICSTGRTIGVYFSNLDTLLYRCRSSSSTLCLFTSCCASVGLSQWACGDLLHGSSILPFERNSSSAFIYFCARVINSTYDFASLLNHAMYSLKFSRKPCFIIKSYMVDFFLISPSKKLGDKCSS